MARKANDLLDIFRYQPEGDDGDTGGKSGNRTRRPARKAKARKRPAAKTRRRTSAETYDLQLSKRHVILGGSVLALLLVLSFTLGLAAGRGGESSDDSSVSLQRNESRTKLWFIEGVFPARLPSAGQPVRPEVIRQDLEEEYALPRRMYRILSGRSGFRVLVGPFKSEAEAVRYVAHQGMEKWAVAALQPFRSYKVVSVPKP